MLAGLPVRPSAPQHWADLGCGEGTFTRALARLLPSGSTVHAWDLDAGALRALPPTEHGVTILPAVKDLTTAALPAPLDGVLLANALHFVSDAPAVLRRIHDVLWPGALLCIAEYDGAVAVPRWVPFPVDVRRLEDLLARTGFDMPHGLAHRASRYGRGDLYTAYARKPDRA